MDSIKIGSGQFSIPDMLRTDWYSWTAYQELTDDTVAVYILRGSNDQVLYVGFTEHLRDEIHTIEYITKRDSGLGDVYLRELEKILYYVLRPKYSSKKIVPQTMYRMRRRG